MSSLTKSKAKQNNVIEFCSRVKIKIIIYYYLPPYPWVFTVKMYFHYL